MIRAVYDPVTGDCELAGAGHPPPVPTWADGTSRLLALEPGTPLGVGAGRYRTSRVQVPAGSQLLLYTDGLVEVRGRDLEHGTTALRDRVSAGRHRPLDQLCQHLLDQVESGDHPDDVALLVARLHGLPAERVATWTFAADPGMAGHTGWLTDRTLRRWGLHRAVQTVVPLADQLVADAVRHGAGPVTLRLVHGAALLCEIADTSGRLPAEQPDAVTGGRGGITRWTGSPTGGVPTGRPPEGSSGSSTRSPPAGADLPAPVDGSPGRWTPGGGRGPVASRTPGTVPTSTPTRHPT